MCICVGCLKGFACEVAAGGQLSDVSEVAVVVSVVLEAHLGCARVVSARNLLVISSRIFASRNLKDAQIAING